MRLIGDGAGTVQPKSLVAFLRVRWWGAVRPDPDDRPQAMPSLGKCPETRRRLPENQPMLTGLISSLLSSFLPLLFQLILAALFGGNSTTSTP